MINLRKLSNRLYTFASKQAFFVLLCFLVVILISMQFGANGMKRIDSAYEMLDMRHFGYSQVVVYDLLTRLWSTGRLIYKQQLGIDFLFAVIFALFQSVMITGLMKRSNVNESWRVLNLLPLLRSGLDVIENCLLLAIIFRFPEQLQGMVVLASMFTLLKWFVYVLIMGTLFILGGYMASKSITKNISTKAGKTL